MGSMVENIRAICKEKGIAVSQLEHDLGYGNGYLNPRKIQDITVGRAVQIADYLGVTMHDILRRETKKAPAAEGEGMESQLLNIFRQLTPEGKEACVNMARSLLLTFAQKNHSDIVTEVS